MKDAKFQNQKVVLYKRINKKIWTKIRDAREAYFENKYLEIEELRRKHNAFNMYKTSNRQ